MPDRAKPAIFRVLRTCLWGVWAVVLSLFAMQVVAELPQNLRFKHIELVDKVGQPISIGALTDILQDHQGYLWVSGENGLARFNGLYFDIFRHLPSDPHSLSNSYVSDLLIDREGALWVASVNGLNRYDPARNAFTRFNNRFLSDDDDVTGHITDPLLESMALDANDALWLGFDEGVVQFNAKRDRFLRIPALTGLHAKSLVFDQRENLWIGTLDNGLYRYHVPSETLTHWVHDTQSNEGLVDNYITALHEGPDGAIWVGTMSEGLNRIAPDGTFSRFQSQQGQPHSLPAGAIWNISFTRKGEMWLALNPGGIAVYRPKTQDFQVIEHLPFSSTSISSNKVLTIHEDRVGDIWIGSFSGTVDVFNRASSPFINFKADAGDESLSDGAILAFCEDSQSRIWVGTESGLNEFHPETQTFTQYRAKPGQKGALQADSVLAITEHVDGSLWVGTWSGGAYRFDKTRGVFKAYTARPNNPRQLGDNYIWSLLSDSQGRLWLGTETSGLALYRPKTDDFQRFHPEDNQPNALSGRNVRALLEDHQGHLWVGTINGLNRMDSFDGERASFSQYFHDPSNPNSLSSNRVIALFQDSNNHLWVGTFDGGLNRLNIETGEILRMGLAEGLPSNNIGGMVEDNQHQLWVTTANGVAVIDLKTLVIKPYYAKDGLVSNHFNRYAVLKKKKTGQLFLGSSEGFSITQANRAFEPSPPAPVVLSELRVFNEPVLAGDKTGLLTASISETDSIRLSHKHAMFAFTFFALSYRSSHQNTYAYKLEGFDKDWNYIDNKNTATFTNIDPGEYIFKVRAANSDGVWNEDGVSLAIIVESPPWATPWAYTLYILLVIGVVAFVIQDQRKRIALRHQQKVNDQLVKLDRIKDAFLANTSHELRTPLNGIIGLAESILDGAMGEVSDSVKHSLKVIVISGRRLSKLINDILDHAKLNEQKLTLRLSSIDLHLITSVVLDLSGPLANKKAICLVNKVPVEARVLADENRLQQMLHNLVGNAIKFTVRGEVTVTANREGHFWAISVRDTGVGIGADDIERVFSAFTQVDHLETREQGGTGLGLAITKQLVELHGGTIDVHSNLGEGSEFIITLPVAEKTTIADDALNLLNATAEIAPPSLRDNEIHDLDATASQQKRSGETILVVDDDSVNRFVIKSMLSQHNYNVLEAEDGPAALKLMESGEKIDLVILDVMMPKMSGFEVCMRIRVNFPIERLPVLFLTARSVGDDLIRGFVSGGNSYLFKPVEKHQLLTRILRHIAAAKTNQKLVMQVERTETKNRAQLLGLDVMEAILKAINQPGAIREIMAEVSKQMLTVTGGQAATLWRLDENRSRYQPVVRINHSGQDTSEEAPIKAIEADRLNDLTLKPNQFVLLNASTVEGALAEWLKAYPVFNNTYFLLVYYSECPLAIYAIDQNADNVAEELEDTLNRLKSHVVAAIVKALGAGEQSDG